MIVMHKKFSIDKNWRVG